MGRIETRSGSVSHQKQGLQQYWNILEQARNTPTSPEALFRALGRAWRAAEAGGCDQSRVHLAAKTVALEVELPEAWRRRQQCRERSGAASREAIVPEVQPPQPRQLVTTVRQCGDAGGTQATVREVERGERGEGRQRRDQRRRGVRAGESAVERERRDLGEGPEAAGKNSSCGWAGRARPTDLDPPELCEGIQCCAVDGQQRLRGCAEAAAAIDERCGGLNDGGVCGGGRRGELARKGGGPRGGQGGHKGVVGQ